MAGLDSTGFNKFLTRLGKDLDAAAERYEELRSKLNSFFTWKGALPYIADDLTDEALDRIAVKVTEGVEIENFNAYCYGVAKFVWLEHLRAKKEEPAGDDLPELAVDPEEPEEEDVRLACLRGCISGGGARTTEAALIEAYYDPAPGETQIVARKKLAEELGISRNTLKVRACRIRTRLEACIMKCLAKKRTSRN